MSTSPNSGDQLEEDQEIQNPKKESEDEEPQQQQPQSPLTLTLTLTSPIPQSSEQEQEPDQGEEHEHEEGTSFSLPSSPQPITVARITATKSYSRRGQKRKRTMGHKKLEALRKKFQTLSQNLKPIPFAIKKTLDLSAHKSLLKRLGLWDFVHVKLESNNIRADLIAQLIVGVDRKLRRSEVNGNKIKVSRAALACALKLPQPHKKDTSSVSEIGEDDVDFGSHESISFIRDVVSNWVLLHEETWILPDDVVNWIKLIDEGHAEKVEWATLLWFMVDRELNQGSGLVDCYYASHLQCLMKTQCQALFLEEPEKKDPEAIVRINEDEEEVGGGDFTNTEEAEDSAAMKTNSDVNTSEDNADVKMSGVDSDVKMSGVDSDAKANGVEGDVKTNEDGDGVNGNGTHASLGHKVEEPSVELTLGQDDVEMEKEREDDVEMEKEREDDVEMEKEMEDDVEMEKEMEDEVEMEKERQADALNSEECKVEQLTCGRDNVAESFLQPCRSSLFGNSLDFGREQSQGEEIEDQEEDEEGEGHELQEGGFQLSSKCNNFQGITSGNLIQPVDMTGGPFTSPLQLHHDSPFGHLKSRGETSTTIFGNTIKREIVHADDVLDQLQDGSNKRLRGNNSWDHKLGDFDQEADHDTCMDYMQHWIDKSRMRYREKEHLCEELGMNQQLLYNELQQRNEVIEHLQKAKYDIHQKSQAEIYRLEKELFVMGNILESYRKALKESHRAFSEYRARFPLSGEPLYKDVCGSGGVVLSTMELEKQQLKREEEDRLKQEEEDRLKQEEEDRMKLKQEEEDRLKQEEEERMEHVQIENMVKNFEAQWVDILQLHREKVHMLDIQITDLEEQVKVHKDAMANSKVSEMEHSPPGEK